MEALMLGALDQSGPMKRKNMPAGFGRGMLGFFVIMLMFAASFPVQPLSGLKNYVTFYCGDEVLLAPGGNAHGRGTGMVYWVSEIPQPQGWSEPFTSAPQGAPVAQWASANGYPYEGTAPASSAISLNVTGGALTWTNNDVSRTKGVYNFTLFKGFDHPLYAYDLVINIYVAKGTARTNSAPLYLTITAFDPNMIPIVVLRFNTSGTRLNGNASAYGGAAVALDSFYNAPSTFTVSSGGYGAQSFLRQNASQKLAFASLTPMKYLSINYFINEMAYPNYDTSYAIKVEAISLAPAAAAPAIINAPAGEWWYTLHDGQTTAWTVPPGNGSGTLDLANLPTTFNGEFSSATTGGWKPQGLSVFSVSGGKLNTKGSGTEIANNGLGQPSSAFAGAYYALPAQVGGDFYVAVRVDLSGWTTTPSYAARIGVAITDVSGNIMAYLTASFYNPKMSSTVNLQDRYYGVQPNAAEGGTLLRGGRSSLTVNISRTGSTWNIYCPETETNYTVTGSTAAIGGILLHHANTENSMNGGWDYVRTNLPAEIGILSGNAYQRAARTGTFYANTTITYTATDSGMPLLVSTTRQDSEGLRFAGVSEGDVVMLFGSEGSPVYNATVPEGATGITVTGVQLPLAGTALVTSSNSRPTAQYLGAIYSGETLTLTCGDQGACSLLKASTGGNWSGVLVTGLQQGWKVVATSGGSDAVLYASYTGQVLVSLPTEIDAISVFKPTAAVHSTLQQGAKYVLERTLNPDVATTDTIFYEVSTTGYRYRVEVQLLSVGRQTSGMLGVLNKMAFTFRIYEDGGLMRESVPVVMIGETGITIPVSKTGAYTFAALIPTGSQSLIVKFRDPSSGIVVEGRLVLGR